MVWTLTSTVVELLFLFRLPQCSKPNAVDKGVSLFEALVVVCGTNSITTSFTFVFCLFAIVIAFMCELAL